MLKPDIRQHIWLTKKTFERKLGGKEDDCVISSDSELDGKIELFKCIQTEGSALYRILDQYQERICILAQEENSLGKFLKENGKNSQTTDKVMINTGRATSCCGQMRFLIRPPLLRFFNEIEVFRRRAISDTYNTITLMEKQRTEYRASLSWMKYVSNMLDPDSDRMLEKFRIAQNRVRHTKDKFDKLSLDCLQKIDLLAASQCNMFSHNLIGYMENLHQFFIKSTDTLKILSSTLTSDSHYDFNVLKSIAKNNSSQNDLKSFSESSDTNKYRNILEESYTNKKLKDLKDINIEEEDININFNILDISYDNIKNENLKFVEHGQLNLESTLFDNPEDFITNSLLMDNVPKENWFKSGSYYSTMNSIKCETQMDNDHLKNNKTSSWFDLFSELDPFANPDDMTRQFGGKVADTQAA